MGLFGGDNDFKCKCGNIVLTGVIKNGKLLAKSQIKGQILKNKTNDPKKWSFLCRKCQSEQSKKLKK